MCKSYHMDVYILILFKNLIISISFTPLVSQKIIFEIILFLLELTVLGPHFHWAYLTESDIEIHGILTRRPTNFIICGQNYQL